MPNAFYVCDCCLFDRRPVYRRGGGDAGTLRDHERLVAAQEIGLLEFIVLINCNGLFWSAIAVQALDSIE